MLLAGTAYDAWGWATITVNSLADQGKPGVCTLRDAITAANTMTATNGCVAGKGYDTIQFSVRGTILLASTLPQITDSQLTLKGPASRGITIDGDSAVQVMQVAPGATVNINNLAIVHGNTRFGGGILNQGTLAVTDSTFAENIRIPPENVQNSPVCGGGAIDNEGMLTVTNCVFSKNGSSVVFDHPETYTTLDGGGILNSGTLIVSHSTFSDNVIAFAGDGGGIANEGIATVSDSLFSGNSSGCTSASAGGAISNSGFGALTINRSTFSGNQGFGSGAIENGNPFEDNTRATVDVANSTFSGNFCFSGGGALKNFGVSTVTDSTFFHNGSGDRVVGSIWNFGDVTIINSTFSGNHAGSNESDIEGSSGSTTRLGGTIVASRESREFVIFGNCAGTIIDLGYNISDDNSCGFTATGSLNNTDPMFDPAGLADNGGPTQTVALLSGSPAIDAIPLGSCTDQDGNPLTTDQRGFPRPDAGENVCDIGAYEFQDFAGEPGTRNCHGVSVSALAHQFRGIKAAASALRFPSVKALQAAITAFCKA
jgi:CSLREA domain-containing protein